MLQDVQLCTSELAANAVRHASSPFRVEVRLDDTTLRVSVHDDSPQTPTRLDVAPTSPGGRGLAIVDAVAGGWGWTADPGLGKDVWFEVTLPSEASRRSED